MRIPYVRLCEQNHKKGKENIQLSICPLPELVNIFGKVRDTAGDC